MDETEDPFVDPNALVDPDAPKVLSKVVMAFGKDWEGYNLVISQAICAKCLKAQMVLHRDGLERKDCPYCGFSIPLPLLPYEN